MNENMRKIGRAMSIRMGIAMSFCLSLVGTLSSGHFTVPGFLISFIASSVISLLIGVIVPIGKVSADVCNNMKLERGSLKWRLMESLISDLVYTPIMTLAMVFIAYKMAMISSGGMAGLRFLPMFLSSLLICFVAAYIIIFVIQPLFMKQVMKKYGLVGPGMRGDREGDKSI